MSETQNTIKLTMTVADAKHMVRVLTKTIAVSTLNHAQAQFVSDTVGAVTLHTEATGTSSGYGITYVTQDYPKVTASATGVTMATPAVELKKKLQGAVKDVTGGTVSVVLPIVSDVSECTLDGYTRWTVGPLSTL